MGGVMHFCDFCVMVLMLCPGLPKQGRYGGRLSWQQGQAASRRAAVRAPTAAVGTLQRAGWLHVAAGIPLQPRGLHCAIHAGGCDVLSSFPHPRRVAALC